MVILSEISEILIICILYFECKVLKTVQLLLVHGLMCNISLNKNISWQKFFSNFPNIPPYSSELVYEFAIKGNMS